ncbi:hypothetical protein HOE425_340024 [Hoeflea sp. EC-HK425]|nr:hypothetical protein HOE425_340024 [Hoeflea sp. EC-HK425]
MVCPKKVQTTRSGLSPQHCFVDGVS